MEKNSKRRSGRMSTTKDSDLDGKDSSNEAKTSDDTNKKQDQPHSAVTTDDDSSIILVSTTTATPTKLERSLSVKTRSNKSLSNNATSQQTSTIVTRKRQMSTDLKNSHANKSSLIKNDSQLNLESFLNEDNSNSSSVSGCPLNASFSGYLSQSFGSSYKKLKQLHGNNYEASSSSLSGMGGVKTENASALTNTITNDGEVESIMNCPIQGCTSIGHLDGLTERHFSFDACPIYFGMTSEECIERRKEIETKLVDLEKKLSHANNEKKAPAHKNLSDEQIKYAKYVKAQLKDILKLKDNNQSNNSTNSFLESILNSDLLCDIKNLTTSFLINSITTGMTPMTTNPKAALSYFNTRNAISGFTGGSDGNEAKIPSINDLKVSKFEYELFRDALITSSTSKIVSISEEENVKLNNLLPLENKCNKLIQFGNYEIESWFKSPYPNDYWQLGKIFICQYCLKYMKSHSMLNRHLEKCLWRHPPGREIYRKNKLSFFEVDGKFNKTYCQNLCLLAKLFLDHKTLYFDVEPFLFYVLTEYNEKNGSFEMIGYFSKEKQSINNFNLSCILILPPFMNKRFGKVLIDFSYLLSKEEEKIGSPERPLSDLGLISYRNYWKTKLLSYMSDHINEAEISIKDISMETGILTNDIISTFQFIGLIKYWKGKHVILKDNELLESNALKKNSLFDIDPTCLKWTPYVYQTIINDSEAPPIF